MRLSCEHFLSRPERVDAPNSGDLVVVELAHSRRPSNVHLAVPALYLWVVLPEAAGRVEVDAVPDQIPVFTRDWIVLADFNDFWHSVD